MGHRALVADARVAATGSATDDYVVRYSHWGAHEFALVDATPSPVTSGDVCWATDEEPTRVSGSLGTVTGVPALAAEFVDPVCHEAAYVVSTICDVTAYLPLPAAVGPGTPDAGGVLLALRDDPHPALDARAIRAWARENRPASTATANPESSSARQTATLDRFHDAVQDAFPDRESFRIPAPRERPPPRAREPMTPGD